MLHSHTWKYVSLVVNCCVPHLSQMTLIQNLNVVFWWGDIWGCFHFSSTFLYKRHWFHCLWFIVSPDRNRLMSLYNTSSHLFLCCRLCVVWQCTARRSSSLMFALSIRFSICNLVFFLSLFLSLCFSKSIQINIIDDEEYEKTKNFYLEMGEPQLLEMSERKGGEFPSQALVSTLYPLTPPPFHSPCMASPTGSIHCYFVLACPDLLNWVYIDKGHISILHGAFSQSWENGEQRRTVIGRFSYPLIFFHCYLSTIFV